VVDTLPTHTYQPHLRGPFMVLAETPRNNAVNFLTGAGGFLQQVIYGYTGLRLEERGLVPKFKPLLPSRVKRLVLRNIRVRGQRYDVVVQADQLRLVPRGRVRVPAGARQSGTDVERSSSRVERR
jgi:trehalose/maltose hydrolase-like predicted phosphorylase